MNIDEWIEQYDIDGLIKKVRSKLIKPHFIKNIEKTMKVRRKYQFSNIKYLQFTAKSIVDLINFNDIDGFNLLSALYFVIDIVHLNFQYDNPNLEIIHEFVKAANMSDEQCQIVSAAWMLENNHPVKSALDIIFSNRIHVYLRNYFHQMLLLRNAFQEAFQFYQKFELSLNYSYPDDGKYVVSCLVASDKFDEAYTFIHQYCSPDGNYFQPFYEDYIIEMYVDANLLNKQDQLKRIRFDKREIEIIMNYICKYEPASARSSNELYMKHKNSTNNGM
ncbi:hypothetical protein TRFO_06978 [Tritrichomonas foetus]|uniref:Uncharacterized protein n=1 Tax=Tritrichomonas foetus TaxID=1144522 RepID=A0A1J4JUT1_9EUKA|nr:hypothetical protein TRFO_06978 [Tritrichomonas foetus]|eukprot:OHT02911.1 hypothetical protein TRFO_06978 [Tritrichomonas foetus]